MNARTAILAIGSVYATQWLLAQFMDVYSVLPWFDMPMHVLGGFTVGMLAVAIHHNITDQHHIAGSPFWYHVLFVLGFVMLIAVAWEFHEYVIDQTVGKWNDWPPRQLSLGDTMSDLLLGGLGGLAAALAFQRDW